MCGKAYKKVFDQSANILWAKFFLDTFTAVVYMAFGGKPEGDSFGIAIYEESISAQEISFLAVLITGVVAPVLEEILFRGIIMRRIGGKIGMCGGIFFSALLFGLCHMNVEQGTAAFLAGLVFGLAAWKYSLYPAALLHVINNLYGLLFKIRVEDQDLLGNVLAGVVVLGLIVAAIILLRNKGSAEGIFRKKDKSVKWRECFASKRFAFLLIVFSVLTLGNS